MKWTSHRHSRRTVKNPWCCQTPHHSSARARGPGSRAAFHAELQDESAVYRLWTSRWLQSPSGRFPKEAVPEQYSGMLTSSEQPRSSSEQRTPVQVNTEPHPKQVKEVQMWLFRNRGHHRKMVSTWKLKACSNNNSKAYDTPKLKVKKAIKIVWRAPHNGCLSTQQKFFTCITTGGQKCRQWDLTMNRIENSNTGKGKYKVKQNSVVTRACPFSLRRGGFWKSVTETRQWEHSLSANATTLQQVTLTAHCFSDWTKGVGDLSTQVEWLCGTTGYTTASCLPVCAKPYRGTPASCPHHSRLCRQQEKTTLRTAPRRVLKAQGQLTRTLRKV